MKPAAKAARDKATIIAWRDQFLTKRAIADAQLIAAAPDLLAELREVEKHLHDYVEAIEYGGGAASKSSARLLSIREAIAKATGEAA